MPSEKPVNALLRAYQVGFGDCFLLSFQYAKGNERHVLIDFGSTGLPKELPKELEDTWMLRVAENIRERCRDKEGNPKLHVVVATHRHKDHISGFARDGRKNEAGETTGDIIRSCQPEIVIQPWTEDPDLDDAELKQRLDKKLVREEDIQSSPEKHFVAALQDMHSVARAVRSEAERLSRRNPMEDGLQSVAGVDEKIGRQLFFMGDNNLSNESAVMNLREMGKRQTGDKKAGHYVNFDLTLKDFADLKKSLSQIVPGVNLRILGPPTLEQHGAIIRQRSRDDDEFWMFHALLKNYWRMQAATAEMSFGPNSIDDGAEHQQTRLFLKARVYQNFAPSHTRWFINQVRNVRAEQLLGLVRVLDKALNNTSVILLFETGGKKLLFPGDAQIENWEYALGQPEVLEFLKDTDLYKVGHHGSRNATPKTLWRRFAKKTRDEGSAERLTSVMSTMEGKHGHTPQTAVPRQTLVDELKKNSELKTTQQILDIENPYIEIPVDLT